MLLSKIYYTFKFLVPRRLQIQLRRYLVNRKQLKYADIWPIDHNAGKPPEGWTGWPKSDNRVIWYADIKAGNATYAANNI